MKSRNICYGEEQYFWNIINDLGDAINLTQWIITLLCSGSLTQRPSSTRQHILCLPPIYCMYIECVSITDLLTQLFLAHFTWQESRLPFFGVRKSCREKYLQPPSFEGGSAISILKHFQALMAIEMLLQWKKQKELQHQKHHHRLLLLFRVACHH